MKLAYGVSSVDIPDDCAAALGYRAIFTRGALFHRGTVEIVQDRVARHFPAQVGHDAILDWYGTKVMSWLDNLACTLRGNDTEIYALDEGPFHARASAQASYGYLYVSVWMDAEGVPAS